MKKLIQAVLITTILVLGVSNLFANEQDVKAEVNKYLTAVNEKEANTIDNFTNDETTFSMINSFICKKEVLSEKVYLHFV